MSASIFRLCDDLGENGPSCTGGKAAGQVERALAESRRRLPGVLLRIPFAGRR